MHLKIYLGLAASLFSKTLSLTDEISMKDTFKSSKGKKSSTTIDISDFEGVTFEGSDGKRCYRVTPGSGSYYQDDHNPACERPFQNQYLVGEFDRIENGKAIYINGTHCKHTGYARSGTVEVEEHSSVSEIEVIFPEPSTCIYETVIRVPRITKAPKASKAPKKHKSMKQSEESKRKNMRNQRDDKKERNQKDSNGN